MATSEGKSEMIDAEACRALVQRWNRFAATMDEDSDTEAGCAMGLRKAADELAGLIAAVTGPIPA